LDRIFYKFLSLYGYIGDKIYKKLCQNLGIAVEMDFCNHLIVKL